MQDRIKAAVASVPDDVEGMKVYHELDPTFFSAASSTFIGGIYSMFGLENIADGARRRLRRLPAAVRRVRRRAGART